jgi:hypothetical protein
MKTRLTIAGIGNLIDTAATIYLTQKGYTEANPVMAAMLDRPVLFAAVKIVTMTAVLLFLWHNREDRHAKPLATMVAVVYGAIAVYYGWFFSFTM